MRIRNVTKETLLSENAIIAKTFTEEAFGLILKPEGTSMIFHTRFGIHTFFMKYPIDVVVLDKKNKIVETKHQMNPNTLFLWNPQHNMIIELPAGTIERTKTQVGDTLTF